jgi:hypothetical protein
MGVLDDLFGGDDKVKATGAEKAQLRLGNAQNTYAERFKPANNAVAAAALRDDTGVLRARSIADSSQNDSGLTAGILQVATNGSGNALERENNANELARSNALSLADLNGKEAMDARFSTGTSSSLGQNGQAAAALNQAASQASEINIKKVQQKNDDKRDAQSALFAAASAGAIKGYDNKKNNDAVRGSLQDKNGKNLEELSGGKGPEATAARVKLQNYDKNTSVFSRAQDTKDFGKNHSINNETYRMRR